MKHLTSVTPLITNLKAVYQEALTFLMAILRLSFWQETMVIILFLSKVSMGVNHNSEIARILHRPIRAISFPPDSNMGIFLALAIPLEEPYKSISLSYFFEASYGLPVNDNLFKDPDDSIVPRTSQLPPVNNRTRRNIDRSTLYTVLENKFESAGYPGRKCLLRSICEASEYPLEHNGILGDIFHVIFTPSTSRAEDHLPDGIIQAELNGRNGTCFYYHSLCPLDLFELIGTLR